MSKQGSGRRRCGTEDDGGVHGGPRGKISPGIVDDAAVFIAAQNHLLAANVHARGDEGDSSDGGLLHNGGNTCGDGSQLRHEGDGKGEAQIAGEDEGRRHEERDGQAITGVPRSNTGRPTEAN